MMKQEHINEIKAIAILAIAMIFFASFISFVPEDLSWYTSHPNSPAQNLIRISGAYVAGAMFFIFGLSSYFVVLFMFFLSWNMFLSRQIKFSPSKYVSFFVMFASVSSLFSLMGSQADIFRFKRAGIVGFIIADFLVKYVGRTGTYIILSAVGILCFILSAEVLVAPVIFQLGDKMREMITSIKEKLNEKKDTSSRNRRKFKFESFVQENKLKKILKRRDSEDKESEVDVDNDEEDGKGGKEKKPKIRIAPTSKSSQKASSKNESDESKIEGIYRLPSIDLLDDPPEVSSDKIQNDLMGGASLLEETLSNFGVSARVADIERGPAITRYELEPAPGVKVHKFTSLSDDIALAMKATAVRVVAPIPGKNRVGIEVPNQSSATVFLKDVLSSKEFVNSTSKLTLSLGKDIAGKSMIADLASMPHLMIAGTTGAGKTVCVNGIIMSMLLNASPDEVKFVMVDPKMVELAQYNGIPHLLCPTVTDPKQASAALFWVVAEMESRYKRLSKEGFRNIQGYNSKEQRMPYIVVIIDELADLMQIAAKTVESSITRLAQLSRAVGIHLILATQRPSVDVITGVIKANFPARISFKVASKVDSRTVLDMNGAESLLGRGDMLFIQPGDSKPTRGQCSFVNDEEISKVIQYIKDQQEPHYDETIIKQQKSASMGLTEQKDEYFDEAVKLVIETNQASVSILQRRMRLGYTRAARLIDMMEQQGIIGPYCGSKPRDILVDREQWLMDHMRENENEQ